MAGCTRASTRLPAGAPDPRLRGGGPPGRGGHAEPSRSRRDAAGVPVRASSGASLRAAFLAWLGAAFSLPLVTFAVSPFPEISGAFFAAAAAYVLWQSPLTWTGAVTAALCLAGMVAVRPGCS